jgi:hypothetical protein
MAKYADFAENERCRLIRASPGEMLPELSELLTNYDLQTQDLILRIKHKTNPSRYNLCIPGSSRRLKLNGNLSECRTSVQKYFDSISANDEASSLTKSEDPIRRM